MKDQPIEVAATVQAVLSSTTFRVELDNGHWVVARLSGQMRQSFVKLKECDRVKVELSPFDLTKGRITALVAATGAVYGEGIPIDPREVPGKGSAKGKTGL
jgi:translation initiation factor IF-1